MANDTDYKNGDLDNNILRKILNRLNLGVSTSVSVTTGPTVLVDGTGTPGGAVVSGGALKVNGSAVTQPVSGTFFQATQPVSVADGIDVTQGAKTDLAAASGVGTFSAISLLKAVVTAAQSINLELQGPITVAQASAASLQATVAGNVGGYTAVIKVAPTITAAGYSAGNDVGGLLTLANAVRTPGTGILESIHILDRGNQSAPFTIFIFDANPAAATITDKVAFVFSTDDLKVIAQITVSGADYTTTNSKALVSKTGLGIALKAASGTTLYAAVVTSGTPTYATTADLQFTFGILQD